MSKKEESYQEENAKLLREAEKLASQLSINLVSFYETIKEEKNIDTIIKNLLSMEKEFNLQNNKTERENIYNGWKKEFNFLWVDKNKINKTRFLQLEL